MSGTPWLAVLAIFAGFALFRRSKGAAAAMTMLVAAGVAVGTPNTADATTLRHSRWNRSPS